MRKDTIVRDFAQLPINGIVNMREKTNMLCGKMMDIEDEIRISYNYTVADLSNLNAASSSNNVSYNFIKEQAIKRLYLDPSQSQIDNINLSKWIFELDTKFLLREYLYNEIYTNNPHSPFREIRAADINGGKINKLCYDYIDFNILSRYRLKDFILWTSYHELKLGSVPGSGSNILNPEIKLLYQKPVYSFNAIPSISDVDSQKETVATKPYNDGLVEIVYKQKKSSQYYTFIWYYDAVFERI
jgi:hypothetical protein